jgi:hypothetical protein
MAGDDRGAWAAVEVRLVTSRDLDEGRIALEADVARHECPSCSTELPDRYHFDCPECGQPGKPRTQCRSCGGELVIELMRYVAEGGSGGRVSKLVPGVRCPSCAVSAIEEHALEPLMTLADLAPGPLEILPESGISGPDSLEVLADAEVCGAGEPEEIEKQADGMVLRVGSPSALFDAALALVTEHDPADIFSPTLSVAPGPPYSAAQRRTILRLLTEVQCELGAPVACWSASVGLSEEPLVDPVLSALLVELERDRAGVALALYHAAVAGHAPGRFQNSVHLLAFVLGVRPGAGLGQALRERVSSSARPPLAVLQQLWLAMHPGYPFDEQRVYAAMEAFHERHASARSAGAAPSLPWEEPDFDGYASWLRRLVSELLAGERGGA